MDKMVAGVVELEVGGLDRIQAFVDELNEHLRAAQDTIDALGTAKLDIKAAACKRQTVK